MRWRRRRMAPPPAADAAPEPDAPRPAIRFDDIRIEGDARIDLVCTTSVDGVEQVHPLWFEVDRPIELPNDAVANALSTLAGTTYDDVHLDLAISEEMRAEVAAFTRATVTTRGSAPRQLTPRAGQVLSFSGGFDSLAARALMPPETALVSLDFGGRFARERTFFERFDTTIVSTNLTETPLRRNSWLFMGIAAMLTADEIRAAHHTFGSILEAGVDNLNVEPRAAANVLFAPFRAARLHNAPYVAGLTQVGTLLVLTTFATDLIGDSLTSLAGPGEGKLHRKKVLAEIVAAQRGVNLDLPAVEIPAVPQIAFGQEFAADFLTPYIARHAGEDVARSLVRDIPDEVLQAARQLDLSCYERAHTTLYERFPGELRAGLDEGFRRAGIEYFTRADWESYAAIGRLLQPYHRVIKRPEVPPSVAG